MAIQRLIETQTNHILWTVKVYRNKIVSNHSSEETYC